MPDLKLKGMTIKAGVRTKSMDRKQFDRAPREIKVIPRSNEAFVIVPLPDNTVDSSRPATVEEAKRANPRAVERGMLRFDI